MVNHLAERTGLPKAQVERLVRLYHEEIRFTLSQEKSVRLHGLGTLKVKKAAARVCTLGAGMAGGREKMTINVPEKKRVAFKEHTALKKAVNR